MSFGEVSGYAVVLLFLVALGVRIYRDRTGDNEAGDEGKVEKG